MQKGDLCEWDEVYVNKGECEVAGGSLCEGENELVGGFSFESFYRKNYALEMERMWYYGLWERDIVWECIIPSRLCLVAS